MPRFCPRSSSWLSATTTFHRLAARVSDAQRREPRDCTQCARCSQRLMSGLNSWKTFMPASIRIVSDPAMNIADPR